ncbi:EF-P lysine aminoacylase EpmA [Xanthomonadaceae bacterium JHOS43]|nr:EF-P lysine aminoacylase EpmA [Xanthomonadaceae bacterium JHOS43]MCX7563419.1 EF-P lysine aminoacylase EpmA [Xanthomonadaceae bacterium XH05]
MSADALRLRAQLYATIRNFFATRGVLEVETPILSAGANTEPNIESFSTRFNGPLPDGGARRRWMRTSPEFALKRLLAAGVGDCYELGRVFRDGEAGRRHNPEFTMLEWYRIGWNHHDLAEETCELIARALALAGRSLRREITTYRALYQGAFGVDPFTAPLEALMAPLADHGIRSDGLSRDDWLDLLMTHRLQPDFDEDTLLTIIDFPPSQCALARIVGQDGDAVAARYEVYLGASELANGYHELTDASEQRARFENDNRRRRTRGQRELPIDEAFLAALDAGLPDCAGVALGIERLLMSMHGTDDIADVMAFAFDQA